MKDKITYTTAGGGTVVWEESRGWDCKACGDGGSGKWASYRLANDHARECQARD